ncbi:MAG: acyl carrier protein [Pseudomonadota bacterium]|nr:acyl carrier protein [Pseudomonadota bacterium]
MSNDTSQRIRSILQDHGRLGTPIAEIQDTTDLYQAGLTSHASVSIMLAIEGEFGIEFPDEMLTRAVFSSISAIRGAVEKLTGPDAA